MRQVTQDEIDTTEVLAIDEYTVALKYSIKVTTLRSWRRKKVGPPFIRLGGRKSSVRYLVKDVDNWFQSRLVRTGPNNYLKVIK